jgi:hypothetical protein
MKPLLGLAMSLAVFGCSAASAQCVTIDAARLPLPYNPFGVGGINQVVTLNIHRGGLVDRAAEANLTFLRRPGDTNPYDMTAVSDDGGSGGSSVLYSPPGPPLSTANNNAGEIDLAFGNIFQPNDRTAQVRFTAPVNVDLPAGEVELRFDVKYLCELQIFGPNSGTNNSGLILRMTVLSALQASFVGSSLDFGEIGNLTRVQAITAPDAVRKRSSFVRVASSGPYSIRATSRNGWRMTKDGSTTSEENKRIAYEFSLAGRTAQPGSDFVTKTCARAGVAGEYLPVAVTLLDGGVGKASSPLYEDIVEVTFTPLGATEQPSALRCS